MLGNIVHVVVHVDCVFLVGCMVVAIDDVYHDDGIMVSCGRHIVSAQVDGRRVAYGRLVAYNKDGMLWQGSEPLDARVTASVMMEVIAMHARRSTGRPPLWIRLKGRHHDEQPAVQLFTIAE